MSIPIPYQEKKTRKCQALCNRWVGHRFTGWKVGGRWRHTCLSYSLPAGAARLAEDGEVVFDKANVSVLLAAGAGMAGGGGRDRVANCLAKYGVCVFFAELLGT